MDPLFILILAALLVAVIQLFFCFCKYIPVKLIPLALLAALFIWYLASRSGAESELPRCGVANAIMLMFFYVPSAGVALGWIIYAVIWLWSGDKDDR